MEHRSVGLLESCNSHELCQEDELVLALSIARGNTIISCRRWALLHQKTSTLSSLGQTCHVIEQMDIIAKLVLDILHLQLHLKASGIICSRSPTYHPSTPWRSSHDVGAFDSYVRKKALILWPNVPVSKLHQGIYASS